MKSEEFWYRCLYQQPPLEPFLDLGYHLQKFQFENVPYVVGYKVSKSQANFKKKYVTCNANKIVYLLCVYRFKYIILGSSYIGTQ